jgi:DNA polymerase II
MTLWLLTAKQTVHKLTDPAFRPAFYVHAPPPTLRQLESLLGTQFRAECRPTERTDLWQGRPLEVLEVALREPLCFQPAVRFTQRTAPQARLYDSDLILATLYCWQKGVFPLARVEAEADEEGRIRELACEDDCWAPDYEPLPLRILQVRLAGPSRGDPSHGRRDALEVECEGETHLLDDADFPVADGFARLLKRYDPDLLLTGWGDATILPLLLRGAERCHIDLRLNRDAGTAQRSRARSFTSYGRILFKGSATTLLGRLHIDSANSFMAEKCELPGLWELVRVTKLPAQYAARTTPGTGISYMQMELAWRDHVLIPAQKAEPEGLKSPEELLAADRGGLVFTPRLGLFANVAELDFVSEYPSIMARFNISPETVNCPCCPDAPRIPELGYRVCQRRQGITSRVVSRLIAKRIELKRRQTAAAAEASARHKAQRDALKWLLVCCFGYTGYKNARFGKIEAHEAINAVARETLLVAKETAEGRGFTLLHALVDSLYVWKAGATREECEGLAREIETRTGLPIAVEAFYRFVAFLPSRQFAGVPVPNRFFAVAEDGSVKARGLECRRHDTPPLIARAQREALAILAEAHDLGGYRRKWKEVCALRESYLERIASGGVDIEELVIHKRLTRPPRDYQKASLTAIAAQQLAGRGVNLRPGQILEYVITDAEARVPNDRVRAYVLWEGWRGYDRKKYAELLREAFAAFSPDSTGQNEEAGAAREAAEPTISFRGPR